MPEDEAQQQTNLMPYLYAGLVLIILVIGYFLLYPTVMDVKETKEKIKVSNRVLSEKEAVVNRFDELAEKYSSDKEKFKKMEKLLFEDKDLISTLIQFNTIASNNNLTLSGVSFGKLKGYGGANSDIGTFSVSGKLNGKYRDFIGFLESAAQNLKLIDIKSINVNVEQRRIRQKREEGEKAKQSYNFRFQSDVYTKKAPGEQREETTGRGAGEANTD